MVGDLPSPVLATCLYGRTHGLKFSWIPSPWLGFLLVALAVYAGVAWLGPCAVVPFGVVCVPASWRFLRLAKGLPPAALATGRAIGIAVVLALVASGARAFVAAAGPGTA